MKAPLSGWVLACWALLGLAFIAAADGARLRHDARRTIRSIEERLDTAEALVARAQRAADRWRALCYGAALREGLDPVGQCDR